MLGFLWSDCIGTFWGLLKDLLVIIIIFIFTFNILMIIGIIVTVVGLF